MSDTLMGKDLATFVPNSMDMSLSARDATRAFLRKFMPARAALFRARMPDEINDGTYVLEKLGPDHPYCGYECRALNLKSPVVLRGDSVLDAAVIDESVQAVLATLAEWIPRLAKDR